MYKAVLLFAFFFVFVITSNCQSWGDSTLKNQRLFYSVEVNPTFPGGMSGFYEFLAKNLKKPANNKLNLSFTTVTLQIIISNSGKIVFAEVIKGKYQELEKQKESYNLAALELIKQMPDWTPALQNSHKVACTLSIPIFFVD
jgi:periplasmic protein TonB